MKELSVFVDESGDFGEYEPHSPFYIVALVFHEQSKDISLNIDHLNTRLREAGMPDHTVHTGPIIRREKEFFQHGYVERKRIFNILFNFVRATDVTFHSFVIEKRHIVEQIHLTERVAKQLSLIVNDHYAWFARFDRIVVYYDYGQIELTKILVAVFSALMSNVEFRKIVPADYKLFQAADMICTLELLSVKADRNMLSKSELAFFSSLRELRRSYFAVLNRKRLR